MGMESTMGIGSTMDHGGLGSHKVWVLACAGIGKHGKIESSN